MYQFVKWFLIAITGFVPYFIYKGLYCMFTPTNATSKANDRVYDRLEKDSKFKTLFNKLTQIPALIFCITVPLGFFIIRGDVGKTLIIIGFVSLLFYFPFAIYLRLKASKPV